MQGREGEVVEELFEGNLKIIQNVNLYRFTSDSVLLSRFAKGKKGDVVADFCAGSGIVGLHFYALNPHVRSVTLFEMQEELSEMSARSVLLNGLKNFEAVCCRVQDIGKEYDEKFSLILCNPPYERGGFEKEDYKKALAEVLFAMKSRGIEPKKLQFVRGREGAKPYLILAEGTKGAKEGIDILPDAVN